METKPTFWAQVDDEGRLVVPAEIASRFGLAPGAQVRLDPGEHEIRMHRPVNQLAKIYIEPTIFCNLDCRTCIRNSWDEKLGRMSDETFERILESIAEITPRPTVFFGGLGEPLFHPKTISMVQRVKALGARVEMITNGTILTEKKSRQLIDAGLDLLWVSIDGATPESYEDVRLGAALPEVLENLLRFKNMRVPGHRPVPEIGIAFVAMRRNIRDLPAVLQIGRQVGAMHFGVSNVLPYTEELQGETLYNRTLKDITYMPSIWLPRLSLPKMDFNELTRDVFYQALNSGYNVTFAGFNLGGTNDVCNFIESGSISIGWQGDVSPCLPLLHTHMSYLHSKPRISYRHVLSNVNEKPLRDIWNDPQYLAYRMRVSRFGFAPCTFCGGCEMSESNQEDCFLNESPACGGCLWAQGVIRCP